jgi:hypothetical protein
MARIGGRPTFLYNELKLLVNISFRLTLSLQLFIIIEYGYY